MKWALAMVFWAFFPVAVSAWDEGGHLLVGEIAARRLRPEVVREMEPLVALLDRQFNQGRPYNLVTAAVWLDDQRGRGKNPRGPRHSVNFPCDGSDNPPEPRSPHALWGIDQAVAVLRNRKEEPQARAEALAQVIHLVGDIHQPLHTVSRRRDRGGNVVGIAPILSSRKSPKNLHAFWDAAYRFDTRDGEVVELWRRLPRFAWPSVPGEPGLFSRRATEFLKSQPQLASEPPCAPETRPWAAWAREAYAIACQSGWPAVAGTADPDGVALSPGFIHEAHSLSVAQIVKAGVRLGDLLNALLEPPRPEGSPENPR